MRAGDCALLEILPYLSREDFEMALQFAANLTLFFPAHPFLERFAQARAAGFEHVEFQFPYEHDLSAIARALDENSLKLELFNLPPGIVL